MPRGRARILLLAPLLVAAGIALFDLGTPLLLVTLLISGLGVHYYSRHLKTISAELRTARAAAQEAEIRVAAAIAAEQQLLAAIESVTEGILQVNETARFIHANVAAREMLRLPSRVEGQSAAALIRNPELRWCIERAATGQSFEPTEIVVEERQLLISSRPLQGTDPHALPTGAVIAIVDLTEFRRLESVRRDFVGNVSHELKTPLTSIRGYAETLRNDQLPHEMQMQFLEVIIKNTQRIQRIVDDLLDLSRLQSGGWLPEPQVVDVAALAHDVWIGCHAAHRKHIEFEVAANARPDVIADPGALRQILSNLFDNAIRYTSEGGKIRVLIDRIERAATICVTDTGSGIPRESLPRIFERFYRVDPARSREAGGTGLGLAIVRHLAERMDGEVTAESELGKGTTIRVRLPAAAEE